MSTTPTSTPINPNNPIKSPIQIKIWSDLHCPFCWIGKSNLDQALTALNLSTPEQQKKAGVSIQWKAFQLDPSAKQELPPNFNYIDYLGQSKGWSPEQTRKIFAGVTRTGEAAGCAFEWEKIKPVNSLRPHSLVKYIRGRSPQWNAVHSLYSTLFGAFFKGLDFSSTKDVAGILPDGFTEDDVKAAYNDDELKAEVQADIKEARQYGISGVPFFLINDKYAISGAQPPEVFQRTLSQLIKDNTTASEPVQEDVGVCIPGQGCQ